MPQVITQIPELTIQHSVMRTNTDHIHVLCFSISTGLYNCLVESFEKSPIPFPKPDDLLAVARDYSCDGCFEPMFMGRCEFKFSYIFILQVREAVHIGTT